MSWTNHRQHRWFSFIMTTMAILCCSVVLQPSHAFSYNSQPATFLTTPAIPLAYRFSRLDSSAASSETLSNDDDNDDTIADNNSNDTTNTGLRGRLRQMTGFSLTAFRASLRAVTGISLTALYVATLTATGAWIRQTTKLVLSILPPPLRYFVQPLLILYYAPLFILRNLSAPQNRASLAGVSSNNNSTTASTDSVVAEGWKAAVTKAEHTVSYWPSMEDDDEEGNDSSSENVTPPSEDVDA